jgi:hypothetical protein
MALRKGMAIAATRQISVGRLTNTARPSWAAGTVAFARVSNAPGTQR